MRYCSHLAKELKLHCDNTIHQQSQEEIFKNSDKQYIKYFKTFNVSFLLRAELYLIMILKKK